MAQCALRFPIQDNAPLRDLTFTGLSKQFGFNDAGPIGQTEEFHRLAGNLVMGGLLDEQPAACE
jgi:hypothetical protein